MPGVTDRYGLAISTMNGAAAAAYREGIDCILAAWPGATAALDRAIAADPEFALAHAARARVHAMYGHTAEARVSISVAQRLVSSNGTDRERSHVELLAAAIGGQSGRALNGALPHLDQWPRDTMIMSTLLGAFGLLAFSGRSDHDRARVDLCERHSRDYGEDWWFLTYYGWALTESGDVLNGRRISERAFGLRQENANAVHGLAHAMFEDDSLKEADQLLGQWMPGYDRAGIQHGHLAWHWALLALNREDPEGALALFDSRFRPGVTLAAPMNVVTDGISLLWRLYAYGYDVPERAWQEVSEYSERAFPRAGTALSDAHMGLLAAATGNGPGLDRRISELETKLADDLLPAGPVVPAICRAAAEFVAGDYARCVAILEPMVHEIVRIGGSHAQREVFEDILISALLRADEPVRAHGVVQRRLHRRPPPCRDAWG
ncbi:tetratricopeptide repeat protein [Limibaculum sp. FT325]|uniref:tetratricopeptide repeat protein n=1 Tax=Thermohalobaculum sediminis TaxID=2939436 RepID=UPI0020C189B2|nr:tetratricopeptide repeat protein [Limibaculum sediminis]MCL5779225.1 tetratricopeptide repeat protein [Limibaculum sediminis]